MIALSRRMLALELAAGLSGSLGSALAGHPMIQVKSAQTSVLNAPRPSTTGSADVSVYNYQSGPGWSAAQVKRMARKSRNQSRNKRAHRAKGGR